LKKRIVHITALKLQGTGVKIIKEIDRKRWTGGNGFLCGRVKCRVHHNGKPKSGQQLGRCTVEVAAAGIRNEMEHIQR
jgi:hypothetical protein